LLRRLASKHKHTNLFLCVEVRRLLKTLVAGTSEWGLPLFGLSLPFSLKI
jgi:hypothetical protein